MPSKHPNDLTGLGGQNTPKVPRRSTKRPVIPDLKLPELEKIEEIDAQGVVKPADPLEPVVETATGYAAQQLSQIIGELARRQIEALKLYEPLPSQADFHKSKAAERLMIGSNRGGKTLPCAVEVARAVCGCDPHDKYPKRDGRCYVVGKDGRHLGAVMWYKLGRAGPFKMIRDQVTGLWRAFRPWERADWVRRHEAKPAPPLIPPRMIADISWEKKNEGIPSLVKLATGWEITFISSLADPSKGVDIDLAWFDEELENDEWYKETAARLVDRAGRFIWSATPQAGTQALYDLHDRAYRQRECDRPAIAEFNVYLAKNPHLDQEQKQLLAEKYTSDEDIRVRVAGEWAIQSYKVYPEYTELIHEVEPFVIPADWTRYIAVDPGRQVCAALFLAVPNPADKQHAGRFYLYDELYLRDCDADQFGRAMREKCQGYVPKAFLIDHHFGRQTESGSGLTVEEQYSSSLKRYGVRSYDTGAGFIWGGDNVDAGIMAVRDWLRKQDDGKPKVQVFRTLENFITEIKRYHNRRVNGRLTDKPDPKTPGHLMDCARYLALYEPRWSPPPRTKREGYVIRALREKEERRRAKEGTPSVRLGPARS